MAHVASGLLAGPDDPVRTAFESVGSPSFRPPEYRDSNSLPNARPVAGFPLAMSIPEVRVVGTRIPVVGYMSGHCLGEGWDYDTVNDACSTPGNFSYTQPGIGNLRCTACAAGGGGTGGGGGGAGAGGTVGGDEDDEGDDSDDADDCGGITAIAAPSPDPAGLDTGNLTAGTQAALQCLRREVSENGGSLTVHSAYRSQAYQDHLREVWDKYQTVSGWAQGRCPDVRDNVQVEWERHDLAYRPAAQSQHSTGRAFDASWGVLNQGVDIDDLARECSLSRPVQGDPTHFLP